MNVSVFGTVLVPPSHRNGETFFALLVSEDLYDTAHGPSIRQSIIPGRIAGHVDLEVGEQVLAHGTVLTVVMSSGAEKRVVEAVSLDQFGNDFAEDQTHVTSSLFAEAHA